MTAASGAAAGKVILLGEHTVVYGTPALAAGIKRGARARAERVVDTGRGSASAGPSGAGRDSGASVLRLGGRDLSASPVSETDIERAFTDLLAALPVTSAVRVEAESD